MSIARLVGADIIRPYPLPGAPGERAAAAEMSAARSAGAACGRPSGRIQELSRMTRGARRLGAPAVWRDTGTLPNDLWGATTRRAGCLAGYRNSPESIRRAAIHGGRSVGAPVIGRRVRDAAPCRSGRPQAAPAGMAVDTRAEVVARHGPAISAALGGRMLSAPTGCLRPIGQKARKPAVRPGCGRSSPPPGGSAPRPRSR